MFGIIAVIGFVCVALYMYAKTIPTLSKTKERESQPDICCDALEKWGVCQCESFRDIEERPQ